MSRVFRGYFFAFIRSVWSLWPVLEHFALGEFKHLSNFCNEEKMKYDVDRRWLWDVPDWYHYRQNVLFFSHHRWLFWPKVAIGAVIITTKMRIHTLTNKSPDNWQSALKDACGFNRRAHQRSKNGMPNASAQFSHVAFARYHAKPMLLTKDGHWKKSSSKCREYKAKLKCSDCLSTEKTLLIIVTFLASCWARWQQATML